jgi:hypothetical protein
MGMFEGNGNIVYSVSLSGKTLTIYKSINKGKDWDVLTENTEHGYGSIPEIVVDPVVEDRIYAPSTNTPNGSWAKVGIWIYDGATWSLKNRAHGLVPNIFGKLDINRVVIDKTNSNIIYAAGKFTAQFPSGIFKSENKGNSWTEITGTMPKGFGAKALGINPHNRELFISGPLGNYIYSGTK